MKLTQHARNEIISCIVVALIFALIVYAGLKLDW